MKDFRNKVRPRPVVRAFVVAAVLLMTAVFFGPRLVHAAEWNSWAIQFLQHSLKRGHTSPLPAAVPEGHVQANLWLAQDALASADPERALALVEPLALHNDPFALQIQAAALEKKGDFAAAIKILVRAHDYYLLIELGNAAAEANDRTGALAAFNAALAIEPEIGVVPLANYLTNNGDLPGAEAVLRKALATIPISGHRLSWYSRLGDNLRTQKRSDDAETVYQAALAENPSDWESHIALGRVYYERGDGAQKAIEEFQKAIAIDKKRGDGYFAVAQVLTSEQRFVEADTWYRLAIQRDQNKIWWYVLRANNARSAGDFDLAFSVYQKIVALAPDYSYAYYEMSWAYRSNAQPEEAKISIEKALSLMRPPDVRYYVRAGQIYEWAGDKTQALEAYQRAVEIDPNNSIAVTAINRLNGP